MDKLSFEILSYIGQAAPPVLEKDIYELYGDESRESLHSLETSGYIRSGRRISPLHPDCLMSDGRYTITSKGIDFLESEANRVKEQEQRIIKENRQKRAEWIRWGITSFISLLALAMSSISLAAQLGLIQLPPA